MVRMKHNTVNIDKIDIYQLSEIIKMQHNINTLHSLFHGKKTLILKELLKY